MDAIEGIARALFVTAWADNEETNGRTYSGEDLMDVAPETPELARYAAFRLCGMIEQVNGCNIHALVAFAARSDGLSPYVDGFEYPESYASDFGHYLAMEAMGHGVSWTDNHADVRIAALLPTKWRAMVVPSFEFGPDDLDFPCEGGPITK